MNAYGDDLAHIHDAGFGDFARGAAPQVLRWLRAAGIRRGPVVDVGCGSGIWAARLLEAGYDVLGFDTSAAMLRIARRQAPKAKFHRVSWIDVELPRCVAVTSLGECLNYEFDSRSSSRALGRFFTRVHAALIPGGLLVFDLLGPQPASQRAPRPFAASGRDWAVLGRVVEAGPQLRREITTFRRVGRLYRRTEEVHVQRLYERAAISDMLRRAGFLLQISPSYGSWQLRPGHWVYVALKPVEPVDP
jgi:SAM-dependent methyltransferase